MKNSIKKYFFCDAVDVKTNQSKVICGKILHRTLIFWHRQEEHGFVI